LTSGNGFEICVILPIPWVLTKEYSNYLGKLLRDIIKKHFTVIFMKNKIL